MNKNVFSVLELGSTNSKGYFYENGKLYELPFRTINFKKNYSEFGAILETDKKELLNYIDAIRQKADRIYAFGTSIFRQLSEGELLEFKNWLYQKTQVSFEVVSPEQENKYTVFGAIKNYNIDDTIAVMVGGGGSTEISVCKNKEIIEQTNSPFGVVDVLKKFPHLKDDTTSVNFEEVLQYVKSNLRIPEYEVDKLILAGGNFILRYEKAGYPTSKNKVFSDEDCPIEISTKDNLDYDKKYFTQISLDKLRKQTPDTPKWWDGTRAMCACVDAVAVGLQAKTLIPTNITMVYGIVEEILSNKTNNCSNIKE